ncbi:hypothetical protein ACS0TY_019977 [Phlomoides rotata]
MKEVVCGVMTYVGKPNLADYFPVLESIDPQGILKQMKIYFDKLFAIFDGIIDEKLKSRGQTNDLLEALIDINQRDEVELNRDEIKHMLLDLFVAGTDTTSSTVEWAMTELLRNPDKMSRRSQHLDESRFILAGEILDRMVHLMLAIFVGNFGWKLEQGTKLEELDMDEKFGLTLQKVIPLKAVPMKL